MTYPIPTLYIFFKVDKFLNDLLSGSHVNTFKMIILGFQNYLLIDMDSLTPIGNPSNECHQYLKRRTLFRGGSADLGISRSGL